MILVVRCRTALHLTLRLTDGGLDTIPRNVKSVLHVLPHPGGGGETYVDTLETMSGYRFERFYLAPSPAPREALRVLPRAALSVEAAAWKHDLVHVQGEVACGVCLPALALRPSIVTFNGLNLLRRVSGLSARAARTNLRLVVHSASRTICVSESERADVVGAVGESERVALVYNGVGLTAVPDCEERKAARGTLGVAEGTTVGVWLGGLDPVKDPLTAVRAALEAGENSAFVLLIAGDGALRAEIEQIVASRRADSVRMLGFRRDVRQVLAAADMFVLCSQREGLSFALLEAMAHGLAPVVSDAPGNVDAVGDSGVIVARGDASGFANAFRRLADDESLRNELGDNARRRAAEKFSADVMVSRTREIYESVGRRM